MLEPTQTEVFWNLVKDLGVSREAFDVLMRAGGPAAVLNAHPPFDPLTASDHAPPFTFVKDTSPFHVFDEYPIIEPPLEAFEHFYTPNDLFFVCNEITTARILTKNYTICVEGDAIGQPLELSYNDLISLPSKELPAYLECAGNHRRMFDTVMGKPAEDVQWGLGGVGMASWTGTPLRHILSLAGLRADAAFVNIKGLDRNSDEGGVSRPMTLDKALDEDTLLAYGMNGTLLPPDHGFPVRVLVPGWVGANSVKWVSTITVSSEPIWVDRNTNTYTLQGPDWPQAHYAPAKGAPITTQNIRSSVVLPWPARLSAGHNRIRGFARSPFGKIAVVSWSADKGKTWQEATLLEPILKWGWVFFEFDWNAPVGEQTLMTQARDEQGNIQPLDIPFNQKGYMFNQVYPHPVQVA